jgi:hypothetical protein
MAYTIIWCRADTEKEIEEIRRCLSEHNGYLIKYSDDQFDEIIEEQNIEATGNFRFGVDTYLDSDQKFDYFIDRVSESPGVYFFFDKNGTLIYVGSSKNLCKRIPKSFKERWGRKNVTSIGYVVLKDISIARLFEATMIQKYKPKLNKVEPYEHTHFGENFDPYAYEPELVKRSRR